MRLGAEAKWLTLSAWGRAGPSLRSGAATRFDSNRTYLGSAGQIGALICREFPRRSSKRASRWANPELPRSFKRLPASSSLNSGGRLSQRTVHVPREDVGQLARDDADRASTQRGIVRAFVARVLAELARRTQQWRAVQEAPEGAAHAAAGPSVSSSAASRCAASGVAGGPSRSASLRRESAGRRLSKSWSSSDCLTADVSWRVQRRAIATLT
jgi:hypothetical protein